MNKLFSTCMGLGLNQYLIGALSGEGLTRLASVLVCEYSEKNDDTMTGIAKLLGDVVASDLLDQENMVGSSLFGRLFDERFLAKRVNYSGMITV